ncbi:MAG: MXAN_5187 C-terminal domain-containing protein [Syntrophotaleaceae bacterium]
MPERQILLRALDSIGEDLRELEILYERYFSGMEKREPLRKRENMQQRLRQFVNRRIMQTDLRFRYESLAARYHSYTGYWDRILRLMDEGRYERHIGSKAPSNQPATDQQSASSQSDNEAAYQQMLQAHQECKLDRPAPSRKQFDSYLAKQRTVLSEKFGGREVEFRVVTEDGKPKIKARPKKTS